MESSEMIQRRLDALEVQLDRIEGLLSERIVSEYVDVNDAARMLCVSVPTVRRMCGEHRLPYVKSGARVLFKRADLEGYMNKNRRATDDELAVEASRYNRHKI